MLKSIALLPLLMGLLFSFAYAADLNEEFEDGIDNWVIVDEPAKLLDSKGPSDWSIKPGPFDRNALNQTNNIWGDIGDVVALGTFIIYDKAEFKNFDLSVDIQANDNDGMGIVFGWKSRTDHYRFFTMIDPGNPAGAAGKEGDPGKAPWSLLEKRTGDERPYYKTLEKINDPAYQQGVSINIRLVVKDGSFEVFAGKKAIMKAKDTSYTSGKIGFTLYAEGGIFFDNLKIIDNTAPVEPKTKLTSTWGSLKSSR
jgi:hypothetical protein